MKSRLLTIAAVLALFSSCQKGGPGGHPGPDTTHYPAMAEAEDAKILSTVNGVNLYNGGYGSAMAQDPF